MASRPKASKNAPEYRRATSTRLRVMHPDVKEVLRNPRRGRPKNQPPPPKEEEEEVVEEEVGDNSLARYNCSFQDEGGRDFAPPQLVWGKVRSHPWWPGQVFDAADASELALQHTRAGAPLVAYFWDKTFAWTSALLPFRTNFPRLAGQSTMSGFVSAVDAALQEVGRRVEAGLSCACFGISIAKRQEIENSGVREGAYGAVVDGAYMRDMFRGRPFLDYILALGRNPLSGTDSLDLTTAKAQLRALNCSRGLGDLPEFVIFEGIEDVYVPIPHTKRKRMEKSGRDVLDMEKKSRCGAAKKEVMHEGGSMPSTEATYDTLSKEKKSKNQKSSAKKNKNTSKDAHGLETVGANKMPSKEEAVGEILSGSKSGHRLRSTCKGDTLDGLKDVGSDGSGESLKGEQKNTALLKENKPGHRAGSARKKNKITGDGDGLKHGNAKVSVIPGKKSGCGESSVAKKASISEQGRKKKKLSELMAMTDRPNSSSGCKSEARGKRSIYASTEKLEDPDSDLKDTVKTRKRKKLDTLGDLSSRPQPVSHKSTTKVRGLMHKAAGQVILTSPVPEANGEASQKKSRRTTAGQMIQTSPVPKANGEASQKKSRRTKDSQVNAPGKLAHSMKTDAATENLLPCCEMLSQLSLAAFNLKKREKNVSASIHFFTDFRKYSYASISDVEEEIYRKAANTGSYASSSHVDEEPPEKAACSEPTPLGQPVADHMKDDYWADILINVEEPLSSLRKKKDKGVSRTSKKAKHVKELTMKSSVSLGNLKEPSVEVRQDSENVKNLNAETKLNVANGAQVSVEEMENSSLAGLVLHFSRPGAVPSRSDLIKIFSQYGPVKEAKAETVNNGNCAQVIFKRRMDAEAAFAGAGKISALGPALVSFRLSDFPVAAPGNEPPQGVSKSE
ncbi:hypothetical protein GUJ93_ZPchr0007g5900 [Zizania palustris]|uniref:PWWP domain-containing protein n=1 Tax=Zizania palustris TaxID=103762 RepID=A0A8J5T3Z7_ZIZPA|nr:hypothetical protein GUJ93_ZPchr0007g5900 [Zizania palustris]KAG8079200.1 hypothetical protein GUJ93_ZPchr0007g5900 [Zizania palustris]KAG8079201.1 hypothetical protein GUJ93_ZPchr0007g5900 [Zizania palustris]